jgi:hypothetical protein
MVVNYERRWYYLAIPKTASTTLHTILTGPAFRGEPYPPGLTWPSNDQHRMDPPPGCESFRAIASIRNPFSRAVSGFRMLRAVNPTHPASQSFDDYCEQLADRGAPGPAFWGTLNWWIGSRQVVDFVRQEHLEADLCRLGLHNGPLHLPRLNQGVGQPVAISARAASLIRSWAEEDFARFNYPPELPSVVHP